MFRTPLSPIIIIYSEKFTLNTNITFNEWSIVRNFNTLLISNINCIYRT